MSLDIFVAGGLKDVGVKKLESGLSLTADGYYWFLYRYFESANLDRRYELLDLYAEGCLEGYQLDRLEDELKTALLDTSARPDAWNVLVGWNSGQRCRSTEDWRPVQKAKVVDLIHQLLGLIREARDSGQKLVYFGD